MNKDEKEGREPSRCCEGHSRRRELPVQRPRGMFEKQQGSQRDWSGVNERESRKGVSELRGCLPCPVEAPKLGELKGHVSSPLASEWCGRTQGLYSGSCAPCQHDKRVHWKMSSFVTWHPQHLPTAAITWREERPPFPFLAPETSVVNRTRIGSPIM